MFPSPAAVAIFILTAYAPNGGGINCGDDCSMLAGGIKVTFAMHRKVVACSAQYPLWTKFEIEGVGTVTCLDRGGGVRGNHLDLLIYTDRTERQRCAGRVRHIDECDAFLIGRRAVRATVIQTK